MGERTSNGKRFLPIKSTMPPLEESRPDLNTIFVRLYNGNLIDAAFDNRYPFERRAFAVYNSSLATLAGTARLTMCFPGAILGFSAPGKFS